MPSNKSERVEARLSFKSVSPQADFQTRQGSFLGHTMRCSSFVLSVINFSKKKREEKVL